VARPRAAQTRSPCSRRLVLLRRAQASPAVAAANSPHCRAARTCGNRRRARVAVVGEGEDEADRGRRQVGLNHAPERRLERKSPFRKERRVIDGGGDEREQRDPQLASAEGRNELARSPYSDPSALGRRKTLVVRIPHSGNLHRNSFLRSLCLASHRREVVFATLPIRSQRQ
jgi:hypothetical protein